MRTKRCATCPGHGKFPIRTQVLNRTRTLRYCAPCWRRAMDGEVEETRQCTRCRREGHACLGHPDGGGVPLSDATAQAEMVAIFQRLAC